MMQKITNYEDFSMMNDLHSILSGCKAVFTWDCSSGLDILRQACGGHGFSKFSGIITPLLEVAPNVTLEGDNTVMSLQTARYLVKSVNKAMKGGKLMESVEYLKNAGEMVSVQRCTATSMQGLWIAWKHPEDTSSQCNQPYLVCYPKHHETGPKGYGDEGGLG